MGSVLRALHLVALSAWFGGNFFFTFFTALPIIRHMRQFATDPNNWLKLREDQATRLAGEALTAVFDRYFLFQTVCGVVALATALAWAMPFKLLFYRCSLLSGATLLAVVNYWWLEPTVSRLRLERYAEASDIAARAEAAFNYWHTLSLGCDIGTLVLAAVALILLAPASAQR